MLKIVIAGPSGAGKSGVATLLSQVLRDYGLTVTLKDSDGPVPPDRLRLVLKSLLAHETYVEIETRTSHRE